MMRLPRALLRRTRSSGQLPVWAYVAHAVDNPYGPAFRGRCLECPLDMPIYQVPGGSMTAEAIDALLAEHPTGPIVEAAARAYRDLARHLNHRHGLNVAETLDPARLRNLLGRPPK